MNDVFGHCDVEWLLGCKCAELTELIVNQCGSVSKYCVVVLGSATFCHVVIVNSRTLSVVSAMFDFLHFLKRPS